MHLTLAQFAAIVAEPRIGKKPQTIATVTELTLAGLNIEDIDDISSAKTLNKLNLSENTMTNAGIRGLTSLPAITMLNLSNNNLVSFKHLENLSTLIVLNLSNNNLTAITREVRTLVNLRALVLNNNHLTELTNLEPLTQLTTLVVSHNKLTSITCISTLTLLTKISATNNLLSEIPDLISFKDLKEIRLSHNKIKSVEGIDARLGKIVEIVDLGNNLIEKVDVMKNMVGVVQLNLKGNGVCEGKEYKTMMVSMMPQLRVLDGERFDERFQVRKKKRKIMDVKRSRRDERNMTFNSSAPREVTVNDKVVKAEKIVVPELPVEIKAKRVNPFEALHTLKKQKKHKDDLKEKEESAELNMKSLSGVIQIVEASTKKKADAGGAKEVLSKTETVLSAWD